MFICNHCPFVKHINGGLVDFTNDLMNKNIGVIGINSNDSSQEKYAEDSIDKMKKYASELGYQFPYVVDEDQSVAKSFTAQCTPDFFLFNNHSELIYRGQFDFSRPGNNKPVTGESLNEAVELYLNSNETVSTQHPSMGCNIKWKIDEEPEYFLEIKG
jgi:hypothetical protein